MGSKSSSVLSPASVSPWSEHVLEITTPESKYLDRGDSAEGRVKNARPPLPRVSHSSSMVSSPSGDIFIFGGMVDDHATNDTWAIKIPGDSDLPLGQRGSPAGMRLTASLVETTGDAPSPRIGHQSALANGRLVVWGGQDNHPNISPEDNSIYSLNISTHHWTKLDTQPAPGARTFHAACLYGNKFIVLGGMQDTVKALHDLWSLDLDSLEQGTPKWEPIEPAPGSLSPPGLGGHVMVAYEGQLYVFGGSNAKETWNDIWCFDMTTRVWTELKCFGDLPSSRAFLAAALVGNAVYIHGGLDKEMKALGDAWSFKIDERRWYRFPDLGLQPSARAGQTMTAIEGRVFVIWGTRDSDQPSDITVVHILDTNLIEYPPEQGEITVKLTPSTTRPPTTLFRETSSGAKLVEAGISKGNSQTPDNLVSEVVEAKHIESEADDASLNRLAKGVENIGLDTRGSTSEETRPRLDQDKTVSSTVDTITGAMSAIEILRYLVAHGCWDISSELDTSHVSEYPISSGGFGDVYFATLHNGDRVGLKCMRVLVDPTEEGRKFLKHAAHELYVWSKCKHPSILELSGVTLFRNQVAMVSPWVENGHLRRFLSRNPQANRCTLCVRIADGVEYLHKSGTIHGDLKPDNILIAEDHTPKLTDFGNAVLSEYTLKFTHSNTALSMTMRWTAPEILNEETKSTEAGDVYALGMIIYEAITDILPYAGARDAVIMRRILTGNVPSRPESHIPTGVEQADRLWSMITRCWAFDPLERPKAWEVKNTMEGITPEWLLVNKN